MSSQSDDDARKNVGRPPRRSDRTQDSVDSWSGQDSAKCERSRAGEQANSPSVELKTGAVMDGTLLKELQAVTSEPRVKRTPTDEAGKERARSTISWH